MTAEIAILNSKGIALAADSAVSIGNKKVYNSANKLFSLSKNHPIGIMIFGNAEFMSVPWETIIKAYRNDELLNKSFLTLKEYSDNFLEYLKSTTNIGSDNEQLHITTIVYRDLDKIRNLILERLDEEFKKNPAQNLTETLIAAITDVEIAREKSRLTNTKELVNVTKTYKSNLKKIVTPIFDQFIKEVFENIKLSNNNIKTIFDCCIESFYKESFKNGYSGIVISGFGSSEIFPRVFAFNMEGRTLGLLKYQTNVQGTEAITVSNQAAILPFAQREMVDTFMSGVDPELNVFMLGELEVLFNQMISKITNGTNVKIGKKNKDIITQNSLQLLQEFNKKCASARMNCFIRPIIDSVTALPLDELASMAEALVNLTSFKRRVTMVAESVGGPIDVAVISKGDGFIWIQRKQYFKPELNHHYFNNYFTT